MYGSGEQTGSSGQTASGGQTQGELAGEGSHFTNEHLQSNQSANKDHGILRQIMNPQGDKYDATRYGDTATIDPEKYV